MLIQEMLLLEDLRDPTDPSYEDAAGDAPMIDIGNSSCTSMVGLLLGYVWLSMDCMIGEGRGAVGSTLRLTVFVVTNCLFGLLFTIPITLICYMHSRVKNMQYPRQH